VGVEIEVARRHIEAYNRRDLVALRAHSDPDLELDWSGSNWLAAGVYRGIESVLAFYGDYFEAFSLIVVEPERITLADGAVVIPNVARMKGRQGIELVARSTLAFTIRRGRVARICLL
jgi:ketosteroid isomerase-like protein